MISHPPFLSLSKFLNGPFLSRLFIFLSLLWLGHFSLHPLHSAQISSSSPPAWMQESIFYHVYVRSFCDSNGDGKGDLDGLTSKLDYLQSLGVNGLLLLPVFQNDHDEYGGYATTDFFHVEDDYGGDPAWDRFVA